MRLLLLVLLVSHCLLRTYTLLLASQSSLLLPRTLARFAEIYEYFKKNGTSFSHLIRNCCDSCREFALRALACLKADLVPSIAGLEQVKHHKFRTAKVPSDQAHNQKTCESASHVHASSRLLRVVQDSSGEENDEMAQ